MIYELGKVSLGIFTWFPRYWTYIPTIGWKIGFFEVKCHFLAFSHKWKNQFFVEYSTGVEISTVKFCEKKLMMFVDIPNKYLELILITYENIQKINRVIFFRPHGTVWSKKWDYSENEAKFGSENPWFLSIFKGPQLFIYLGYESDQGMKTILNFMNFPKT